MTETFPIEGWAAIYGEADLNDDVLAPGAFRKALARTGAHGVKLLNQHAVEDPIGRWLAFEERNEGLYARGEICLATRRARETAALIRAGILDGLSVGFRLLRAERAGGARRIVEADLWEVSVVTFPMAPRARILRAGGETGPPSAEAFAATVREAARILSA